MKEKILKNKLRSAIIAAIVLVAAISAVVGIKIEPNDSESAIAYTNASEGVADAGSAEEEPQERTVKAEPEKITTKEDSSKTNIKEELQKTSTKEEPIKTTVKEETQNKPEKEESQNNPSKEETQKKPEKEQSNESKSITAYISIDCSAAVGNLTNPAVEPYVPAGGGILGRTAVSVPKGSTVYDVLTTACRNAGVQYDGSSSYITGIGHLYEFDAGPRSGWMYSVNGTRPNVGCGSYKLNGGEEITWNYVLSY